MSNPTHYTLGAVAPDARALADLDERLVEGLGGGGSVAALCRRRDEGLVRAVLGGARVEKVETGLSRRQWLEFASAFFAASTVSFLMGVVHLWTGLIVQAALTVAAIVGLLVYHRLPRLEKTLAGLGLPDKPAAEWATAFPRGLALVLATVSAEDFEEAQDAFLADEALAAPLAVDRRPVF